MDTIKILFFSPYFYPYISGITQYPFRFFSGENIPALTTTCVTFKHEKRLITREKVNDNLSITRMPFIFRLSKGFISPQSLFIFWREAVKTDVIIINLPSFEGIALALIAKIMKKPLVVFLHCEVQLPPSPIKGIINFILNTGVTVQLFFSNKIIVETKDYFKNKWPYNLFQHKICEVLPLVQTTDPDLEYIHELEKIRNTHAHIVGFCGRIASEKGLEVLIESLEYVTDTILLFAGPTEKEVTGENAYFEKIQNLLYQKKISHRFLGILSEKKLSSFYRAIDVLVLPSVNKTEAFGIVQIEAMIQKTPVIASQLPGVRIPIRLTKMGILVPLHSAQDLKKAILEIISKRKKYSNTLLVNEIKKVYNVQEIRRKLGEIIKNSLRQ